jgi:hypothetical protein
MKIFNIQVNGKDTEWFCSLSQQEKIDWIKRNTNQQNDSIINEFLSQPLDERDCDCGCGGNKNKTQDANISERNVAKDEAPIIDTKTKKRGKRASN